MPAPVSIIIPTLNAARELPETLTHLIEGLEAGIVRELVVSDGGSVDETRVIADGTGAVIVQGSAGRGGQLQRGAKAAQGDWFLLVHADTHLSPGWSVVVADHMKSQEQAAYFRLRFRATGFRASFTAGWANLRSKLGLPYGDQGLLISRGLFDQIGGYPDIPLMEDVAIACQLRGQLVGLNATAFTSAARYQHQGWLRRGTLNLWTLIRYMAGADPAKLARDYSGADSSEN